MSDYIHLTVATICKADSRFLIVEEFSKDGRNVINQPAGHVDLGETIYDAAIRETLEETAWLVEPQYLVGIYQNLNSAEGTSSRQYLRICFYCKLLEQTNNAIDPAIIRTHWLTADEILAHTGHRSAMVRASLNDFLAGKKISLDILNTLS